MNIGTGNLGLQSLTPNRTEKSDQAVLQSPSKPTSEKSAPEFSKVLKEKSQAPARKNDAKDKSKNDEADSNQAGLKNPEYNDRPQAAQPTKGGNAPVKPANAEAAGANNPQSAPPKVAGDFKATDIESLTGRAQAVPVAAQEEIPAFDETGAGALNPMAQEAIMKFLVTMKAELGVEPQEVMEAMGRLDVQDLLKAPEDTMNQVLDGLNLGGQERVRAAGLYQTMLKETAEASLKNMTAEMGRKVDLKVLTPEEAKMERQLASLDRLNREFFPRKDSTAQQNQNPWAEQTAAAGLAGRDQAKSRKDDSFEMPKFFGAAALGAAAAQSPAAAPKEVAPPVSDPFAVSAQNAAPEFDAASLEQAAKKPDFKINDGAFKLDGLTAAATGAAVAASESRDASDSEGFEKESESWNGQPLAPQQSLKPQEMFSAAALTQVQTPMAKADEAANARHLIQGAQLLIQRGGGEMKIQLRPEGMGAVDLKVSVQDGKVDIRMMAENNDTKRLLESNLADLKDNLLGQKLHVDTLKVDVAPGRGHSDLDSQFAQQQREMAREFLGQFRQQNQAGRQQFLDTTGIKNYGQRRGKTLTPADVPSANRARDNSRRLDLVA